MEGKAGLHPGGRAGGLRAPGAGGSNPSPLVCGAGVRVGGADPWLLLGGSGVSPRGKSGSPGTRGGPPQRDACPTRVLIPPPGGLALAPRPRPPGPPSHPRARCSAGGGIGWGRGAEAAAGTTSLPAASLCARGASGGGERASERQPERGGESERAGEGARRRPRLRSARLAATLPSAARRARRPAAAAATGAPAGCRRGQGSAWDTGPRPGTEASPAQPRAAEPWGRRLRCSARPLNGVGWWAVGFQGARRTGDPDLRGTPTLKGVHSNRTPAAPDLALIPCVPHFCTNFSDALARGGRGERWGCPVGSHPAGP